MLTEVHKRITLTDVLSHPWFQIAKKSTKTIPIEIFKNLQNYADNKLKKLALNFIVKNLQQSEIQQLTEIFREIDKNKSGLISFNELQEAVERTGMPITDQEIQQMIQQADYIGNGKINYSEFIAATLDCKEILNEENL